MPTTLILLALLGLTISKIMVLDNVDDLRQLTKDSQKRKLDWNSDTGMLPSDFKRLLENRNKHAETADVPKDFVSKWTLDNFDQYLELVDENMPKRRLENSNKHAVTTVTQHKLFGFGTKKYICYQKNGSYRAVNLEVSTKKSYTTIKGCTLLVPA